MIETSNIREKYLKRRLSQIKRRFLQIVFSIKSAYIRVQSAFICVKNIFFRNFTQIISHRIKFFFILLLVVFLSVILQLTFLNYLKVFSVGPDLLFILTILCALNFKKRDALITGFSLGLIKDTFSASAFGINTVLFVVWVLLIEGVTRRIYKEQIQTILLISSVFIGTAVNALTMKFWLLIHGTVINYGVFFARMILEIVYNLAATFPLSAIFKKCVLKYYK